MGRRVLLAHPVHWNRPPMRLDLVISRGLVVKRPIGRLLPLTCEERKTWQRQTSATIDQNILSILIL
jgi:hypothetical protein